MRGGARKGSGRKPVSKELKRNPLHSFRAQQWIIDWLLRQSGSGGQLIEKALMLTYPELAKKQKSLGKIVSRETKRD